jgi:chemotaxis protein methyltransferase CheR
MKLMKETESLKIQLRGARCMIALSEREFTQLVDFMKRYYGVNLTGKKHIVISRLHKTILEKGFKNFGDYFDFVMADQSGAAIASLVNKLTTNHTFFLREIAHFNFFRDQVLPHLKSTVAIKDLRIWSAGCSSGEEAYCLAMIIHDFFGSEKLFWDTKLLATDISEEVLEIATSGIFSNEQVSSLPEVWRKKYFKKNNDQTCLVVDQIRKDIIFRKFNLMTDIFPFKKRFQVIFCRNVMIYFDGPTRRQLVNKFYDCMESGGYLFIGHSESLRYEEMKFKYVQPAVYRKE